MIAIRANGHRKFKKPKRQRDKIPSGVANFVSGLIRKCGHEPISPDPPGSGTKQNRILLFP
jgi:hypothetical protein